MARMTDKEQFLHDFRREANDTCRLLTNVDPQSQSDVLPVRNALNRLVVLRRALRYAKLGRLLNEDEFTVASMSLDGLKGAVTNLAQELETRPEHSVHFRSRRVSMPLRRGAPRYDISKTQLQFLLNCRFKKKQIAAIMHVSTKTVHNRLKTFNLATREYCAITDEDLDSAVRAVMMGNRRIGANAVLTRLNNNGVWVPRERVRQSIRRVDPAGVALRSRRVVKRRVYNVAGPNTLWHLDGNHKLIRWRIVVHGGIDGYSRLITFMDASTSNHSNTVLKLFQDATRQYGIPSRIRCDNGGENSRVCEFMEMYHGPGRGSAIRGRSVHNQRIERNWLDMWNGCVNVFYDIFVALERTGLLDPNSDGQMYALHFVYLPRIRHALQHFVNQWNHHKMRTEHSLSPTQLFVHRSLELHCSSSTAMTDMFENRADQDHMLLNNNDTSQDNEHDRELITVDVPMTTPPISEEQAQLLSQQIDPLAGINDGNLGVDLYLATLDLLRDMLDL